MGNGRTWLLIIGILIYFCGVPFWAYSLRYENLANAIVAFTLLNLLAVTLIGTYYFGEELTLINKAGIVLAMLSVVLVEL